jgi:hypothetical protein
MRKVMVKYTVKPDRASENEQYIRTVFEALEREKPAGLRYASFKLPDGVSFVHIAMHNGMGDSPLTSLPEFKAFTAGIKDRCDVFPETTVLGEIGSYNTLGS